MSSRVKRRILWTIGSVLLFAISATYLVGQRKATSIFGDEPGWIGASYRTADLLFEGRYDTENLTAIRRNYGNLNPPLGKLMLGVPLVMYSDRHLDGERFRLRRAYTWIDETWAVKRARGEVPTRRVLFAARAITAIYGSICVLAVFAVASIWFGARVGALSAFALLGTPAFVYATTRAMTDVSYNLFLFAGSFAVSRSLRTATQRGALALAAVCGFLGGLASSVKITGFLVVGGVYAVVTALRAVRERQEFRAVARRFAVFAATALACIYALNPFYWPEFGRFEPAKLIAEIRQVVSGENAAEFSAPLPDLLGSVVYDRREIVAAYPQLYNIARPLEFPVHFLRWRRLWEQQESREPWTEPRLSTLVRKLAFDLSAFRFEWVFLIWGLAVCVSGARDEWKSHALGPHAVVLAWLSVIGLGVLAVAPRPENRFFLPAVLATRILVAVGIVAAFDRAKLWLGALRARSIPTRGGLPEAVAPSGARGRVPARAGIPSETGIAIAAALMAPIAIRVALLVAQRVPVSAADGIGVLTDGSAALAVAALISIVPAGWAALRVLLVFVWGLMQVAHYEHVMELGAGLQFTFAAYLLDPTFVSGSVLAVGAPALAAFVCVVPAALILRTFRSRAALRSGAALAAGALVLAAAAEALPMDPSISIWRQRHFLVDSLDRIFDASPSPRPNEDLPAEFAEFTADLSGDPIVPLPGIAKNVILLVLEGLPASVLESIGDSAQGNPEYRMKRFSAISRRALVASNFVMHQRQTNRGMYSLLCGDYPKLDHSLARMTEYLDDSTRPCLPRILDAAGYRTVYLQGAPLAFMYKDQFTRRAGFHEVLGNESFARAIHRTAWGVDDKTLLRRVAAESERLAAGKEPFFLTVLTVGTHHPAVLPPRFVRRTSKAGFEGAAAYLDEALGDLVERLEATGILDDTLLILTSDESRGNIESSNLTDLLTRNWGPLVVRTPEAVAETVVAPFGQSDVALSILDYLGIDPHSAPFIGRSFFRRYASGRRVFFANTAWRQTGAVDAAGIVDVCDLRGEECKEFDSNPATVFVPTSPPREPSADAVAQIRTAIRYSRRGKTAEPRAFEMPLAFERDVPLRPGSEQILMDGQFLYVPANGRVEVDIECRVEGSRGVVRLRHEFADGYAEPLFVQAAPDLRVGDRLRIRYAYATTAEMTDARFGLWASAPANSDLRIHIERAEVRVAPVEAPVAQSGFVDDPIFAVDVRI